MHVASLFKSAGSRRQTPNGEAGGRHIAEVGWLLTSEAGSVIFEAPRALSRNDQPPQHAKSASYCPAILDHEARLFEVPCPYDLHIGFKVDDRGEAHLVNLAGDMSAVRPKHLGQLLALVSRKEWRHPDRPVVQIVTPYVFVADEPVYMTQLPPFAHYRKQPLPGTVMGGRLPIHIWPRTMMWAFEWYSPSKPIVLKRGEPWFYVRFETQDPSRPVRLIEAAHTPDLQEYMKGISGVTNYVQRTFSPFSTAKERRPAKLVVPRVR
jgi:hypothetical protein